MKVKTEKINNRFKGWFSAAQHSMRESIDLGTKIHSNG